jgi:hypothetical protein
LSGSAEWSDEDEDHEGGELDPFAVWMMGGLESSDSEGDPDYNTEAPPANNDEANLDGDA